MQAFVTFFLLKMSSNEEVGSDLNTSPTNTSWTKNCAHLDIQASFEPGMTVFLKFSRYYCISENVFNKVEMKMWS